MQQSMQSSLDSLQDWTSMPELIKTIQRLGRVYRPPAIAKANNFTEVASLGDEKCYGKAKDKDPKNAQACGSGSGVLGFDVVSGAPTSAAAKAVQLLQAGFDVNTSPYLAKVWQTVCEAVRLLPARLSIFTRCSGD
jgi:hypothetical protein